MSDTAADPQIAEVADTPKTGIAWGNDISEERKRQLEAILAAWDAEAGHGVRKGPFDVIGLEYNSDEVKRRRLTGADVFHLAACALVGVTPPFHESIKDLSTAQAALRNPQMQVYLNLSAVCLADADLSQAQPADAFLRRVNLERANLESADLSGADLNETQMELANLNNARLRGPYLSGAQLQRAHLYQAQLSGADLKWAYLSGADLYRVQLESSNLRDAKLEGTNLSEANLAGANLQGAVLDASTNLKHIKLGDGCRDSVRVADLRWGGANLAVVDWSLLTVRDAQLGDERAAHEWKPESFQSPSAGLSLNQLAQNREWHKRQQAQERLEVYRAAMRANRQLATALREQGMNEEADAFAYRAQVVQRSVFAQQGKRGRAVLSWFLNAVAGHGYKPARSLYTYLGVLFGYAFLYFLYFLAGNGWLTFGLGASQYQNLPWYEALILSVSSFHGRGFFQPLQTLGDPVAIIASVEAVFGLFIEGVFIATFPSASLENRLLANMTEGTVVGDGSGLGDVRWGQRHGVAQLLQSAHMVTLQTNGVESIEIVGAQVGIGSLVAEHMVDDDQHTVGHSDNRLMDASTLAQAPILRHEIVITGVRNRPDDLPQDRAEPRTALGDGFAHAFAPTLLIARTQPRPGGEVFGRREAAHVDAELGDDGGGGRLLDARNGLQQTHRLLIGLEVRLDLRLCLGDRGVKEVDMGEDGAQHKAMLGLEVALQRAFEFRDLGTHARAGALRDGSNILFA